MQLEVEDPDTGAHAILLSILLKGVLISLIFGSFKDLSFSSHTSALKNCSSKKLLVSHVVWSLVTVQLSVLFNTGIGVGLYTGVTVGPYI